MKKIVTPSQIGQFTYCAKAWDLKRCGEQGVSKKAARAMESGVNAHVNLTRVVKLSSVLTGLGLVLVFLSLLWYCL